ncbi:MAG: glycosyltransferase [Chloroflexota bacterium]|nr:MAG: hypothetical protein DLM70_05200 [Chloroflexota bacterium]
MKETIGILHFTAWPVAGGVEMMIASEARALLDAGWTVRIVTGRGDAIDGAEHIVIPEMLPPSRRDDVNAPDEDSVRRLSALLARALQGCGQCWVHNILTVDLHPGLTVAVQRLVDKETDISFVNWCCDLSAASAFVDGAFRGWMIEWLTTQSDLEHVAISHVRRHDLACALGVNPDCIPVVSPPCDVLEWFGLHPGTRRLCDALDLLQSDIVVLVPAKVLPHKHLELAVEVGAELQKLVRLGRVLVSGGLSPHETERSCQLRETLLRLISTSGAENTVHFLADGEGSYLESRVVRELIGIADIVLLPSFEEGFGMPLMEAAALRVPVLCSDIPAFREAAGQSVRFFPTDASSGVIARMALAIAREPVNADRRRALGSFATFTAGVTHVASRAGVAAPAS